MTVFWTNNIWI